MHEQPDWLRSIFPAEPERRRPMNHRPAPLRKGAGKVGRNDPCPCNSGRKWKRCCMWSTR